MLAGVRTLPQSLPIRRLLCKASTTPNLDQNAYREAFAKRMAMAGLKPHHRIALGVSGGADSVALCVLTAGWKKKGLGLGLESGGDGSGFVYGLLGIVVDHKLRPESSEEAKVVCGRVCDMGIRCEVVACEWKDNKPKQGHLEEAARDMRYQFFQDVCIHHQIGALLIGHHSDDQAELFILRLSRNSGILGLAGMAFVSQLFLTSLRCCPSNSRNHGTLLIRPMLDFSKQDMYKICQANHQEWVEDPTNQSSLFTRNRIRMSLRSSSCQFKSELHAAISACRLTRSLIERQCSHLLDRSVIISNHGYATIDLKKLNPSVVDDLCLSKFLASVLQFISQRHRPIRGGVSQLLLDYIRTAPCKTALTAAGCYLCATPGSKGTKILVCASLDSPEPSRTMANISNKCSCKGHPRTSSEINEVLMGAKRCVNDSLAYMPTVALLNVNTSSGVLEESRKHNLISESTFRSINLLQLEERTRFNTQENVKNDCALRPRSLSSSISGIELRSGQTCHFMNRFLVSWHFSRKVTHDGCSLDAVISRRDLKYENTLSACESCRYGVEKVASVRAMVDADWLFLANLAKSQMPGYKKQGTSSSVQNSDTSCSLCLQHACLSAQRTLSIIKPIPLPARRALPVLVDSHGLLLSIPSVSFQHCPFVSMKAIFRPRVPLGGGFSSYI